MSAEAADNLVVEDDGVQHFTIATGLMVYSPVFGTMHVAREGDGWRVKHAAGLLPPGWFFDAIGFGHTLVQAICDTAGYGSVSPELRVFAERVEDWAHGD